MDSQATKLLYGPRDYYHGDFLKGIKNLLG